MIRVFSLASIILASHSFITAFFLFRKKSNQKASLILGLINILFGTTYLMVFLSYELEPSLYTFFISLRMPFIYVLYALFYLYTVRLAKIETKNDYLHFIPAFVVTLYILIKILPEHPVKTVPSSDPFSLDFFSPDLYILLQGGMVTFICYQIVMLRVVRSFNRNVRNYYSSVEKHNIFWLQVHIIISGTTVFLYFLTNILRLCIHPAPLFFDILEYLCLSMISLFLLSVVYFTFSQTETPEIQDSKQGSVSARYTRQRLPESLERSYVERLLGYMEKEKPYLEPELDIDTLARGVDIPSPHLTMVLNLHIGKNFHQFINDYRVAYACRLLAKEKAFEENILNLALDAGFNSKTSFNTHFRRVMKTTPREYRRDCRNTG